MERNVDKKRGCIIYYDYLEQLYLLSLEERGVLLTAILEYGKKGVEPQLEGTVRMAFSFIRGQLDRDSEKYNIVCEKRRAAGKKGGRPKRTSKEESIEVTTEEEQEESKAFSENQKLFEKPKAFFENQVKAKKPDIDEDVDKEKGEETDNETDTDTLHAREGLSESEAESGLSVQLLRKSRLFLPPRGATLTLRNFLTFTRREGGALTVVPSATGKRCSAHGTSMSASRTHPLAVFRATRIIIFRGASLTS